MDTSAGKMMHCTSLKPSTFKYPQKVSDYGGWPLGSRHCSCWVPGVAGGAIATKHGLQLHLCQWNEVQGDHSQWFSWILFNLMFPGNKTLSLQLTSALPVTCCVVALWTELWLQWRSVDCLWSCSGYTPRFEIKDPCNLNNTNKLHSPEVALDIQSELIFINGMPRNETLIHQQLSLHQLHHPHPSQRLLKPIFPLMWCPTFNIPMCKIIAACIECATALRANNESIKR